MLYVNNFVYVYTIKQQNKTLIMYQLIETSEILDINTIEGVSIKELESVGRKLHTPKYTQETLVSTAFMKHILNEKSRFSKSMATTSEDDSKVVKVSYYSVADAVEKVTHTFNKK